jgi:hypothetical protein
VRPALTFGKPVRDSVEAGTSDVLESTVRMSRLQPNIKTTACLIICLSLANEMHCYDARSYADLHSSMMITRGGLHWFNDTGCCQLKL